MPDDGWKATGFELRVTSYEFRVTVHGLDILQKGRGDKFFGKVTGGGQAYPGAAGLEFRLQAVGERHCALPRRRGTPNDTPACISGRLPVGTPGVWRPHKMRALGPEPA